MTQERSFDWDRHERALGHLVAVATDMQRLAGSPGERASVVQGRALCEAFQAVSDTRALAEYANVWNPAFETLLHSLGHHAFACDRRLGMMTGDMYGIIVVFPDAEYATALDHYFSVWHDSARDLLGRVVMATNLMHSLPAFQDKALRMANQAEIKMDLISDMAVARSNYGVVHEGDIEAVVAEAGGRIEWLSGQYDQYADFMMAHVEQQILIGESLVTCAASNIAAFGRVSSYTEKTEQLIRAGYNVVSGVLVDMKSIKALRQASYFSRDVQRPAFIYNP